MLIMIHIQRMYTMYQYHIWFVRILVDDIQFDQYCDTYSFVSKNIGYQ